MEPVLRRDVVGGLDVDVMPFDRDENAVGEKAVIVPARGALLGICVAQERAVTRVDQQHLAGAEPPSLDDIARRHGHDAGRRANDSFWEHRIYRDQKRPVLLEWVKQVIVKYVQF